LIYLVVTVFIVYVYAHFCGFLGAVTGVLSLLHAYVKVKVFS